MKIISLKYLEENFSEIIDRAQAGETFLLDTPDGQIALVPDKGILKPCLLYTSPSPRDLSTSRMPSSA